tara:strand:+ start:98 stop:1417 length:1320 start_codon:yes stop_codon:yes gene_type:complete
MPPAKPKAARSAAVRAKNGDLGARLELMGSWVQKVLRGDKSLTFGEMLLLPVIVAVIAALAMGLSVLLSSRVRTIKTTDSAALKHVFFSGEPWLVECLSNRSGTSSASSLMEEAAPKLGSGISAAVMNCDAMLPSGKTTLQRFKLTRPSKGRMFLLAANVDRPLLAPNEALRSGVKLAAWATRLSKPLVVSASSSPLLEQHCLKRKWCVLVVAAGGRLVDAERAAIQSIAGGARTARCVTVDSSKMNLSLDLPGGIPPPAAAKSTVILLKTVESQPEGASEPVRASAAMLLESGLADVPATREAIKAAIEAASAAPNPAAALPEGFTRLSEKPSAKLRQPAPKPKVMDSSDFDKRRESWKEDGQSSKTLTDEELKQMRAERAAEAERLVREREEQRRQQMAAEENAAGNIVEEDYDGEEDDSQEVEEEEVESMELDEEA